MRRSPSALAEGIVGRDRRALARAITLVESTKPSDRALSHELFAALPAASLDTVRIGITGIHAQNLKYGQTLGLGIVGYGLLKGILHPIQAIITLNPIHSMHKCTANGLGLVCPELE